MKKYRRRRSLVVKISVLVSVLVLVGAGAAARINASRMERLYTAEKERQIMTLLDSATVIIKSPLAGEWFRDVAAWMEKTTSGNVDVADCLVIDKKNIVVFDIFTEREEKKFNRKMLNSNYKYLSKKVADGKNVYGEILIGYQPKTILEDQRTKEIIEFARSVSGNLSEVLSNLLFAQVKVIVEDMIKDIPDVKYCIVIHKSGTVLFHSLEQSREGTELKDALSEKAGRVNPRYPIIIQKIRDKGTGVNLLDVAVLVRKGNEKLGIVRIGYSMKSLENSIRKSQMEIFLLSAFFAAFSILFSVALARRISRPVIYLSRIAHEIGQGVLDRQVKVKTGGDELELLGDSFNEMIKGLRERNLVKDTFSRYVTWQVAEEILKDPDKIVPGGSRQEVTVLFSDIRGFTTFSETHTPEEVLSHLNEYLSAMVDVIFKYEGTLDKFIGDAVMAVFGSPIKHGDDPLRAVKAALEMKERLNELNKKWGREGKVPLEIGIGINTGEVIAGNIGDVRRMEYTVIGDNVNLASRIEGLTKNYGCPIIISENTYEKVRDIVKVRELGNTSVKGKTRGIEIFELLGLA